VRSEIFHDLNGFDPRFFLHCDDIDLSWRIRNLGFNLIYCVDATFFHDKSVAKNGFPILSESESFFGPLGALLLAHKYGLKKGLKHMQRDLEKSRDPVHIEILRVFRIKTKVYKTERIRRDIPTYYHPWKFAKTRF
jgi:GT2 family glycosyltransferase